MRKLIMLMLLCMSVMAVSGVCYATDLDSYGSNKSSYTSSDDAVGDFFNNITPITKDNMASAQAAMSPLMNGVGTFTGIIIALASVCLGLITALDLLYIAVPFVRPLLYSQGKQWVSDECLACVGGNGGGSAPSPAPAGMGGFNPGMGGGMPPAGGMPAPGGNSGGGVKYITLSYLKRRMVFIIAFVICTIVLTSSVLLKCGVNIAELILKIFGRLNGQMSTMDF